MLDLLVNLAAIGVTVGSMYALIAVSFALIFNVTHVFHFAHGALFTIGAYVTYLMASGLGLPFVAALAVALVATALLGVGVEMWLYRPLRQANATFLIFFLTSVGLLIVTEGVIGITFGPQALSFAALPLSPISLGPVTFTTANLAMLGSWLLIGGAVAYLHLTRTGRFLRAMGDSPRVATTLGLPQGPLFLLSFALGSAMAVPAGVLYGWFQGVTPVMGLNAILISSTAVIIGGRHGLLPGALTALALGVVQALLVAFVPTGWEQGIAFALLVVALLLRPQGIFGYALRW